MYEGTGRLRLRQKRMGVRRLGGSTYSIRKDSLIVQYVLCPVHECIDVVRRSKLRGTLVAHPILPKVFVSEIYNGQ
jgi:hypothetical protein